MTTGIFYVLIWFVLIKNIYVLSHVNIFVKKKEIEKDFLKKGGFCIDVWTTWLLTILFTSIYFFNIHPCCLCYRKTLRFNFLRQFKICRHCSDFRYTEYWNFRILNCACVMNTKPNSKQKRKRGQKKLTFFAG